MLAGRGCYRKAGGLAPPASPRLILGAAAAALIAFAAPVEARAAEATVASELEFSGKFGRDLRTFYKARGLRPLWVREDGPTPAADRLIDLVASAHLDGLDPDDYRPRALAKAVEKARGGSPRALAKAELLLARALVRYVRDVRRPPEDVDMAYVDRELQPSLPTPRAILDSAGRARSLTAWIEQRGWMNPIYAGLREAYADTYARLDKRQRRLVELNLDRARALPANMGKRFVLVDAAAARLWAYEDGKVRETMRVVVGKPDNQTPMMAAMIRFTVVNPYWNVPPDLTAERIAPKVLDQGVGYLKSARYEVLSGWSEGARVVDPRTIDWAAVASGDISLRVRELPGKGNSMGRMKFMFPNRFGVYLHDTPDRGLFEDDARLFSAGCVRLEDAPRLARWLYGKPLKVTTRAPEHPVPLKTPVPVYITYLTAAPDSKAGLALRPDIYGRDGKLGIAPGTALASR